MSTLELRDFVRGFNRHKSRQAFDQKASPDHAREKYTEEDALDVEAFIGYLLDVNLAAANTLGAPTRRQLLVLLEEISRLHRLAYGWSGRVDCEKLIPLIGENDTPRRFIRALIETMDVELATGRHINVAPAPQIESQPSAEDSPEGPMD